MVRMIDVTTKDLKVAKYELEENLGFVVETKNEVSDKVPAGVIISQEQKAGEEYPKGSTVVLTVSSRRWKNKSIYAKCSWNEQRKCNSDFRVNEISC